jgi:hypothetical protein
VETPEHTGWRHDAGWSLVISRRVLRDGHHVHELKAFADPEEQIALASWPDLNAFLLRCGRTGRIGKESWGDPPLRAWDFEDMPKYHLFAQWLADATAVSPAGTTLAYLRDAHDDRTMRALQWLSALSRDRRNAAVRLGFMLGGADGSPDRPCELFMPVLLSMPEASLMVELRCEATIALADDDGSIAGLQILCAEEINTFELPASANATPYPEFVLDTDFGIALGDNGWEMVTGAAYPDEVCRFRARLTD